MRARAGWLHGFSGLLAGGLAALAVGLFAAWIVAKEAGATGPGTSTLVWHTVAAVTAVAAQVFADRRTGLRSTVAAVVVIAVTAAVMTAQWII
jgi:hypothetical protein